MLDSPKGRYSSLIYSLSRVCLRRETGFILRLAYIEGYHWIYLLFINLVIYLIKIMPQLKRDE